MIRTGANRLRDWLQHRHLAWHLAVLSATTFCSFVREFSYPVGGQPKMQARSYWTCVGLALSGFAA